MATINPYLNFIGTCEAAFNFYKSAFGTEFTTLLRFKDMPAPGTEKVSEQIAHVALPIGGGTILMGSDAPEGFGPPLIVGNNFSVSVTSDTREEADHLFNTLSAGGHVTMPIGNAPWGAYFGMFTDKFGINWMVSFDAQNA